MNELWPLKFLTSEVEVKIEAEVKIEVRFYYGMGRSVTTKNFRVLAFKMNKLWPFKSFDL